MDLQQLTENHFKATKKGCPLFIYGADEHTAISLQHSIDVLEGLRDRLMSMFLTKAASEVESELTKLTEQLQSLKK